ncbi:hypothetical protein CA606_01540 [Caulobacter vibrioides]|uniref:Uncharacterized protein n=1 Tax=Caulobacter vibrioides TaxID=155892 RepID=A0A290MGI4_CAUVI|nr:hypothetical protein [Caulobacter vibrioides]ATC31134.1 hypothetical protein CA606_01540 [Caulobacter vibrioides]
MRVLWGAVVAGAALAVASASWGQTPAPTAGFAVPVEALKLGGAKAGFMESGASAGGRQMLVKTYQRTSQGFVNSKSKITKAFRFMTADGAVTLAGKCVIRAEGRNLLGIDYTKTDARGYNCAAEDQAPEQYAMEVALPSFGDARIGGALGLTIKKDRPTSDVQAVLRGRLIYAGVAYEAKPTGFYTDSFMARRVVRGYDILRDGKLIGRLSYPQKEMTSTKDQGDIIVPTSQADGRDAVLFMVMSLNAMPDVYAEQVRREISWY